MEWLEVFRRIAAGEGPETEFKSGFVKDAVGRAICAFANSEGGVVILGVDDSGAVTGVKNDPEDLHERLTTLLQSGCSAPVRAACGRQRTSDGWVHWIDVPRLRGVEPLRHRGRFWIRRERSSVEPSASELQEMFNTFGFVLTESQVIQSAGIDAIDSGLFQSFLRSRGINLESVPQLGVETDLLNQRVIERVRGAVHPTLYGLMVFGIIPQKYAHTANFYIQCVAYRGNERGAREYSVSDADGTIDKQVASAMTWFRSLGRREVYSGLFRRDLMPIPEEVMREALVNAVIHRDYAITGSKVMFEVFDDHITVTSPGSLPNHMTVEQVKAGGGPRSRNEAMANAMVIRGLVEQRGRGWPLMRYQMREFNGTEPELANDNLSRIVRVTLHLDAPTS